MVDLYAIAELERRAMQPRPRPALRDEYKLIRGKLFHDTRSGARLHILSFCLDHPQQGPVVTLPIIAVS